MGRLIYTGGATMSDKVVDFLLNHVVFGGGSGGGSATLIPKSITANGRYVATDDDADGYSEVTVAVQAVSRENEILKHSIYGEYTNASVTSVGEYAFYACQQMTSVNLPEVTRIGSNSFEGCLRLQSVYLPKVQIVGNGAFKDTALHQLSLPACTSVNTYAFSEARSLESVSIPNVTDISLAQNLFEYCSKLREIEIGAITKIPSNCFSSCSSLESVDFKDVTQIESSAFYNCSKLKSVDFPLITLAAGSVFKNCTALTSVNLPSVIQCGSSSFSGCKALVNIVLPACTALSYFAFLGCNALETVDLPVCKNLNFSGIFENCTNLKAVILRSTDGVVPVMSNAFNPSGIASKTGYIYVPASLIDAYKANTNWSTYASQFRALEDYTIDGTTTGALDPNKI